MYNFKNVWGVTPPDPQHLLGGEDVAPPPKAKSWLRARLMLKYVYSNCLRVSWCTRDSMSVLSLRSVNP